MSRPGDKTIKLKGTHMGESAKAVKFSVSHISDSQLAQETVQWFPFSQVDNIFKNPEAIGEDELTVSEWICKQKELFDKDLHKAPASSTYGTYNPYTEIDDDVPF